VRSPLYRRLRAYPGISAYVRAPAQMGVTPRMPDSPLLRKLQSSSGRCRRPPPARCRSSCCANANGQARINGSAVHSTRNRSRHRCPPHPILILDAACTLRPLSRAIRFELGRRKRHRAVIRRIADGREGQPPERSKPRGRHACSVMYRRLVAERRRAVGPRPGDTPGPWVCGSTGGGRRAAARAERCAGPLRDNGRHAEYPLGCALNDRSLLPARRAYRGLRSQPWWCCRLVTLRAVPIVRAGALRGGYAGDADSSASAGGILEVVGHLHACHAP